MYYTLIVAVQTVELNLESSQLSYPVYKYHWYVKPLSNNYMVQRNLDTFPPVWNISLQIFIYSSLKF